MLKWFNKSRQEKTKTHAEKARKNQEHLVRERVALQYDYIRSWAQ
jgi:hypothetical protein